MLTCGVLISLEMINKTAEQIKQAIEWGTKSYENSLKSSFMIPYAQVNRDKFITKTFGNLLSEDDLQAALQTSPASVCSKEMVDKIAKQTIGKHAFWTFLLSAVSAVPTGFMMIPFFVMDLVQFQIHVFAVSQKLLYLYEDKASLAEYSSDTSAKLMILMTTVMIGKHKFTRMLKSAAGVAAKQVVQRYAAKAVARLSVLTAMRQVAKWFGITLTKEAFVMGIDVLIIIICAIISGFISYWLFKPMANNLMKHLKEDAAG